MRQPFLTYDAGAGTSCMPLTYPFFSPHAICIKPSTGGAQRLYHRSTFSVIYFVFVNPISRTFLSIFSD